MAAVLTSMKDTGIPGERELEAQVIFLDVPLTIGDYKKMNTIKLLHCE